MSGFVYFLLATGGNSVKVGYGTDYRKRASSIGVSCPYRIDLITAVPGTRADEAALHKALSGRRMSGEWFRWDLITHELIERAQLGAPIEELIAFARGETFERLQRRAGCLITEIEEATA